MSIIKISPSSIFSRIIIAFIGIFLFSSCQAKEVSKIDEQTSLRAVLSARFEHIALNVPDPEAMAKWYIDNLGMKLVRGGFAPNASAFLADSGMHMMLELLHNVNAPIFEAGKISQTSFHLAFISPDIRQTQTKLVAAGAVIADSLRKSDSGDMVLNFRDPWGLTIQFIQRVNTMLSFQGLYPEHLAINVTNAPALSQWYKENLGMNIIRQGSAPSYGTFISDSGKNMMFEFYQNGKYPVVQFDSISYNTVHIAFMVNDIKQVKQILLASGATLAEDIKQVPSGDFVMMLRDPGGVPIQFVQRVNPMLK